MLDRTEPTLLKRVMMDWRNRIGLYGSYFFGMAAIGFTLPYLPLYLSQKGLSDRTIGLVSTLAALSGLAQFPIGLWSDRIGWRKPFLIVALAVLALATVLLRRLRTWSGSGFLVVLFAENGITRAVVESLSGAEAAAARPQGRSRGGLGDSEVLEAHRHRDHGLGGELDVRAVWRRVDPGSDRSRFRAWPSSRPSSSMRREK